MVVEDEEAMFHNWAKDIDVCKYASWNPHGNMKGIDLCCGYGQRSLDLAERGFHVTAEDIDQDKRLVTVHKCVVNIICIKWG